MYGTRHFDSCIYYTDGCNALFPYSNTSLPYQVREVITMAKPICLLNLSKAWGIKIPSNLISTCKLTCCSFCCWHSDKLWLKVTGKRSKRNIGEESGIRPEVNTHIVKVTGC